MGCTLLGLAKTRSLDAPELLDSPSRWQCFAMFPILPLLNLSQPLIRPTPTAGTLFFGAQWSSAFVLAVMGAAFF